MYSKQLNIGKFKQKLADQLPLSARDENPLKASPYVVERSEENLADSLTNLFPSTANFVRSHFRAMTNG